MSKEHRIPKSWKPHLTLASEIETVTLQADGSWLRRASQRSQLDVQFSGICSQCNNGWLREVDEAAKERMLKLAHRRVESIPASEVAAVARFSTRTALMTAWGNRRIGGFPDDVALEFAKTRLPTDGVHVFMGFSDEVSIYAAGHCAMLPVDPTISGGVFIAAWGLEHLFTVAVIPKDRDVAMASKTASAIRGVANGLVRQTWPNRPGRPVSVPSSRSAELTRDFVPRITQARSLLLGERPSVRDHDPADVPARYQGLTPDQLRDRFITPPHEAPPKL